MCLAAAFRAMTSGDGSGARRTRLVVGVLFLHAVLIPQPRALGWGPTGHRVVGLIAERHLSEQAAEAVRSILGRESLAEASTYPDEIRSDPAFRYTAPWHYVTIEDGETYETSERNPRGDVIEAIGRFSATLRSDSAAHAERVAALRWLVHLVADIHQPLHVGRGADRGGNTIAVKWFGEDTNLHRVWDDKMIDSSKLSFTELAKFTDRASKQQIEGWQNSTALDWAGESIEYRDRAYRKPDPDPYGGYRYSYQNMPLVKLRLNQAGIRLAGLLNEIFGEAGEQAGD